MDFNVPLRDSTVEDDLRIRAAMPTMQCCGSAERTVVVLLHLGRPKGQARPAVLAGTGRAPASASCSAPRSAAPDVAGLPSIGDGGGVSAGGVMMLENLRFDPGEEANDPAFATTSCALGDVT